MKEERTKASGPERKAQAVATIPSLGLRWHKIYPILLFINCALGFGRLYLVLRLYHMKNEFPYEAYLGIGLTIVFAVVILAEMVLCLITALQLRNLEAGGYKMNKLLVCFVSPLCMFLSGAVWVRPVIGIMTAVAMGLSVSLPIMIYYEKRKGYFAPEAGEETE